MARRHRHRDREDADKAAEVSQSFLQFLSANPAIASGLATMGGYVVNAFLDSQYGHALSGLVKPAGSGASGSARAQPGKRAPKAKVAPKSGKAAPPARKAKPTPKKGQSTGRKARSARPAAA
jgi:hypothetical protein